MKLDVKTIGTALAIANGAALVARFAAQTLGPHFSGLRAFDDLDTSLGVSAFNRSKHSGPRVDYVCSDCGSDMITCTAEVQWDRAAQGWALSNADNVTEAYCSHCGHTTLRTRKIGSA